MLFVVSLALREIFVKEAMQLQIFHQVWLGSPAHVVGCTDRSQCAGGIELVMDGMGGLFLPALRQTCLILVPCVAARWGGGH